jgi:hypothetical protein
VVELPSGSACADQGEQLKTKNAMKQAELILRLYELRRETVMRAARDYVGGEFMPRSIDEFVSLVSNGDKQMSYILQVYGYWDMIAAFVVHGALDESLLFDTCPEMYFQYAKIQPYLAGFRQKMNLPEFLKSVETVIEGSAQGRARVSNMAKNIKQMAKLRGQAVAADDLTPPAAEERKS